MSIYHFVVKQLILSGLFLQGIYLWIHILPKHGLIVVDLVQDCSMAAANNVGHLALSRRLVEILCLVHTILPCLILL